MASELRKDTRETGHGTASTYRACRCDACRAAGSAYNREYYQRNREAILARRRPGMSLADVQRYQRGRAVIDAAKARPCVDCGESYPPYVMDLDHRDPAHKRKNVARMVTSSPDLLEAEIAKCDVVCANCHRERTHGKANIGS